MRYLTEWKESMIEDVNQDDSIIIKWMEKFLRFIFVAAIASSIPLGILILLQL